MKQKPKKPKRTKGKKMPAIAKVGDQNELVPTKNYPFANWPFENFNPVQSRVFDYYKEDVNTLIAARTSAGKTVVAEMFLAQEIRERGGKGMFLAPLRALAQEKIDQWTDLQYHFKDLKISICTGDYRLTKERAKELIDADLIIMTSEMLNHRSRNFQAEQNNWMLDIGTLVIDESHLLTVPGRGDHLEVGLMKFTEINPKARIVLLSATMPNVDQIAEWVSYSLTKKQTYVLNSQYRPVPLNVHYELYENAGRYDAKEESKVEKALEIIGDWYPDDKFLVFAHTKRTGESMKQALRNAGIKADFHNADLDKDQRVKLERDFRNDPKMRVIIATPTLAWGLNLPARRVIILGVHRGLDEIETYNVTQMIGRSGRLGIDPAGDAYILIPDDEEQKWRTKLQKPQNIESQLLNKEGEHHKVLAFHLVSEIHHGYIETTQDVHRWYERSLAYFQNKDLQDTVVDETLELLQKKGAVKFEDNIWKVTSVGMISSMFYFSPFDVADLKNNFWHLFNKNNQDNDYFLAMALANTDTNKMNIVSRAEKDEMSLFVNRIKTLMGATYTYIDPVLKAGYCYFNLLNGNNSAALAATQRNLQFDYPRVSQVILALDTMAGKWGQTGFLRNLEERIRNGVPSHLVNLCSIPNVGKARAKKLYDAGIRTVDDFADVPADNLRKLLNLKEDIVKQMLSEATKQSLTSS
jgi:helicase